MQLVTQSVYSVGTKRMAFPKRRILSAQHLTWLGLARQAKARHGKARQAKASGSHCGDRFDLVAHSTRCVICDALLDAISNPALDFSRSVRRTRFFVDCVCVCVCACVTAYENDLSTSTQQVTRMSGIR